MRRTILAVAIAVLPFLVMAPAGAITDGEPDNRGHPMVGAVVYDIGEGERDVGCSGSLLSPTVFLTAAHCVGGLVVGQDDLWVTFDEVFSAADGVFTPAASWETHPEWNPLSMHYDIAVIVLEEPADLDDYAVLPEAGLLDEMKADQSLASQRFTNVGYGYYTIRGGGAFSWEGDGVRRVSPSTYKSLNAWWLGLNANPNSVEGQGGVCWKDSGGPHFLEGTFTTVALTNIVGGACRLNVSARLDTPAAQEFILPFLDGG